LPAEDHRRRGSQANSPWFWRIRHVLYRRQIAAWLVTAWEWNRQRSLTFVTAGCGAAIIGGAEGLAERSGRPDRLGEGTVWPATAGQTVHFPRRHLMGGADGGCRACRYPG
jgi:hypothetical protein